MNYTTLETCPTSLGLTHNARANSFHLHNTIWERSRHFLNLSFPNTPEKWRKQYYPHFKDKNGSAGSTKRASRNVLVSWLGCWCVQFATAHQATYTYDLYIPTYVTVYFSKKLKKVKNWRLRFQIIQWLT